MGGVLLLVTRILGINLGGEKPIGTDYDTVEVVTADDFPADVCEAFLPRLERMQKLGLETALAYRLPTTSENDAYAVVFTNANRVSSLMLAFSKVEDNIVVAVSCHSMLQNGEEWIDTDQKKTLDKPPGKIAHYYPNIALTDLWKTHLKRVEGQNLKKLPLDREQIVEFVVEQNREWLEWGRGRGFLVPTRATLASAEA